MSESRLHNLIRVNQAITSDLDLDSVLHRIVAMAAELVDAKFAGMGVLGPQGEIAKFIHSGISPQVEAAIGRQPEGKGLLRAIMDTPRPLSLTALGDDPRSVGFPAGHPAMTSFLGVRIRVREEVYGNLYLANNRHGEFTAEDVELAEALAATAGIAIENARQFDEAIRRERWSRALAEAARGVMLDEESQQVPRLLDRVREAVQAEVALIATIDEETDELIVEHVVGFNSAVLATTRVRPVTESFVHTTGDEALVLNDLSLLIDTADGEVETTCHLVLVPFDGPPGRRIALGVANRGTQSELHDREIEVVGSFTSHVHTVLDRAEMRRTRHRVAMLEDRNRIARDLHDHVIQRLFATGLSLQATATQVDGPPGERLSDLVHEIDGAITQIRQSIFALNHDSADGATLRSRLSAIVERIGGSLPRRPTLVFAGPVDLVTDDDLSHDVEAVVSEALTNAVRHSGARSIDVEVAIADHSITISVLDDGVGPGPMTRRSGLSNLELRARRHDGTFLVEERATGGTSLHWTGRLGATRPSTGSPID